MKARTLTLCLALSLAAAAPLVAGGQGEPRLSEAQRLIQIQDYSGALRLLASIQRENPDLQDETSRLISQVIIIRGQMYNVVLSQLVQAVYVDHDQEKAVALVSELQRIDPSRPIPGVDNAIEYVKFLNLMNRAAIMLAAGKTVDALALYVLPFTDPTKAGFTMQKAGFEAAGYGRIIQDEVGNSAARILTLGTQEIKSAEEIDRVPLALEAYLSKPPGPGAIGEFDTIVAPLREAARSEGILRSIAGSLGDMNHSIQETSGKGRADPYLQYLGWLTLGREKKTEGIAEAVRRLWVDRTTDVASRTSSVAVAMFESARGLYLGSRLDEAASAFEAAASRGTIAVKAAGLAAATLSTTAGSGWALSQQDGSTVKNLLLVASTSQEEVAEAGAYRNLIAYKKELAALPTVSPEASVDSARAAAETARVLVYRSQIRNRSSDAGAAEQEWDTRAADWTSKTKLGVPFDPLALSAKRVAEEYQSFAASDLASKDLLYALRLGRLSSRDFPSRLAAAQGVRPKALDLMKGISSGGQPHPIEAITLLAGAGKNLDGLAQDIADLEERLRAERPYVLASDGLARLFRGTPSYPGLDPLMESIQKEKTGLAQALADAQKSVDEAAARSNEGDKWFDLASKALAAKDADGASTYSDKASEAYNKSQNSAYTEHAAARIDEMAGSMATQIATLRTDSAIANADKDLARIDQKVKARDFLGASDALEAAQRAWDQAQPGNQNLSFAVRKANIQLALQVTGESDLSRMDPKGDAVNTFLKYAMDALTAGRLKDAEQNVNYALTVAPNFRAAKVVALKIKKQRNKDTFAADAKAQIDAYRRMAQDTSNTEGMRVAYNALRDYADLDPAFAKSLQDVLNKLEANLFPFGRPPTPTEIAQVNDLVQRARNAAQPGTDEALNEADRLLAAAFKIDQNNAVARALSTEILKRRNRTDANKITPADIAEFKQAQSKYWSGAYQDAYDIVNKLLASSPANQRYVELIKLKRRCEVALGGS
jgi:hypothetical protein